jgi:hypothetical protein
MNTDDFLTFHEVIAEQKHNPATRWHREGADADDADGCMAFQRIGREFFKPFVQASFSVPPDARFFMIGSCFARGLECALSNEGLAVLSLSKKFDEFTSVAGTKPLGAANRYNTGSMRNEFNWALDPANPFPEEAIFDLSDGTSQDPHMNPAFGSTSREATLQHRKIFGEVVSEVVNADVLVLTLGLVEIWFDRKLDLVMNTAPTMPMIRSDRERFAFGRMQYSENLQNLNEIHRLMQAHGKPGHKIIITVSPVPLAATFTSNDVVQANSYSKSTLRAVATDFAQSHENVDYFPSYEMVLNSDFKTSWIDDKRHPQGKLGGHIMRTFVKHYVEGVDASKIELAQQYVA